jgi:hypothetical protein
MAIDEGTLRGWDMAVQGECLDAVTIVEQDIHDLYKVAHKGEMIVLPESIFANYRDFSGDQIIRMYLASHNTEHAKRVYGRARWDEKGKVIVIPPVDHMESMIIRLSKEKDRVLLSFRNKRGEIRTVNFKADILESGDIFCDFSLNSSRAFINHLQIHFGIL